MLLQLKVHWCLVLLLMGFPGAGLQTSQQPCSTF